MILFLLFDDLLGLLFDYCNFEVCTTLNGFLDLVLDESVLCL